LALGENLEVRIKNNTATTKAVGKINLEGMYRTEEERRKIENRAATAKAALEEMRVNPGQEDAQTEIDDDWLNYFARLAEDKSSEELQSLFGKILGGEIKRPGSFSLRTMQTIATISKNDANALSKLLSFSIQGLIVPFTDAQNVGPTVEEREFLTELGVASHASRIGGLQLDIKASPNSNFLLTASSHRGILVVNEMSEAGEFSVGGQLLTSTGRELLTIANPPPIDMDFLKIVAQQINVDLKNKYRTQADNGLLKVHVVTTELAGLDQTRYSVVFTVG
jgi:hypothetical protein